VALKPEQPRLRWHLALALQALGDTAGAAAEYQEALRLDPRWPETVNRLARSLATHRTTPESLRPEAVLLATELCQATGGNEPRYLDTLAAAQAGVGRFNDAVETTRKALALAGGPDQHALAGQLQAHLLLYQRGVPLREGK
jgi:Flp pilus assembly protein TadD